ncbi:MAG: ribonuclease P protein component [Gammaproteobacteria bacterium]|nr:ribonuclease P protein component [Gammaproteobacteria bacterium]
MLNQHDGGAASPNEAFPRSVRLLTPEDYKNVFQQPIRAGDRLLTVLARVNGEQPSRLGLAIAKKNVRHANGRNRIKRIVRESFRLNQTQIEHLDIVVMAKRAAADADKLELRKSIDRQWIYLCKQLKKQCAKSS